MCRFHGGFCVNQVSYNLEHLRLTFPRYDAEADVPLASCRITQKVSRLEKAFRRYQYRSIRLIETINNIVLFKTHRAFRESKMLENKCNRRTILTTFGIFEYIYIECISLYRRIGIRSTSFDSTESNERRS